MKNNTKKTNNLSRKNFIKKTAAIATGAIILPRHILYGKGNKPPNDKVSIGSEGTEVQTDSNKKRLSFLNKPAPVITGIFSGETPHELIALARDSEAEGAKGIAIDLGDLKPEFRNFESLKKIINSVNLPFMFYFYRGGKWKEPNDDARQEVLLSAAEAGASMIDVMGDLYDPSPNEITYNQKAIDKQKRLIGKIHRKGADVVISSHTKCPLTTEEVLKHMQELELRGSEVVKIVTTINTKEELSEALGTTITLSGELKKPFIHLCAGNYRRPHRFMCPVLGTSILFAVPHYSEKATQPTIKSMKAVLDNIHWNIKDTE